MARIKVDEEDEVIEVDEGLEDVDEDEETGGDEDEGGIFDEDLVDELEGLEGDVGGRWEEVDGSEDEDDFFIGDTILTSADGERSWSKEELEEVLRNERIERDWGDSDEFVEGGFYDAESGNFYGAEGGREGFYEDKLRGDDLYKGGGGGDLYNTGDVYAGKSANDEGVYDVSKRGGMKSYDEVADSRRGGHSVLESMGFEDKEKQDKRDRRGLVKYSAGGAGGRR